MSYYNLRDARAALRVCVDTVVGSRLVGRVYSGRLIRPIAFADLSALAVQIDRVLDAQNFPQAFLTTRRFVPTPTPEEAVEKIDEGMPLKEIQAAQGQVTTFSLWIVSRKNATWQGQVDWASGSSAEFSSLPELLGLVERNVVEKP